MNRTDIEWATYSWNPVTGCSAVSPGCDHCYAETIAERFRGSAAWPNGFDVTLRPHRLEEPVGWAPGRVFVPSMSDLFHEDIPTDYVEAVWDTMTRKAPQHTYMVLTKRPGRMLTFARKKGSVPRTPIPRNVWLGVSVEHMDQAWRVDTLRTIPAARHFVSAEPLLGSLAELDLRVAVDWVIAGGESGNQARPMNPDWVRELRDKCADEHAAFFFKQWGSIDPTTGKRASKKATGRELDGRTWTQWPDQRCARLHPLTWDEYAHDWCATCDREAA